MSLLFKILLILTVATPSVVFAAPVAAVTKPEELPPQPVSSHIRKNLKLDIGCKREFSRDGQFYRLDSFDTKDGERLRPFINEYPTAVSELNMYQKNSGNLTKAATVGTLGLIAMILANNLLRANNVGQTTEDVARYGGGGLLVGAAIFSFLTIRTNEGHLNNAVDIHNQNNSANPIDLRFTGGFSF